MLRTADFERHKVCATLLRIVPPARDGDIRQPGTIGASGARPGPNPSADGFGPTFPGVHVHQHAVGGGSLGAVAGVGATERRVRHSGRYSTRLIHSSGLQALAHSSRSATACPIVTSS